MMYKCFFFFSINYFINFISLFKLLGCLLLFSPSIKIKQTFFVLIDLWLFGDEKTLIYRSLKVCESKKVSFDPKELGLSVGLAMHGKPGTSCRKTRKTLGKSN